MASTILRAEKLRRVFRVGDDEVIAVDDIDLEVKRGEMVAVCGPSGSGKSTLLALLAGLDKPTSGGVWLLDRALHSLEDRALSALRRQRVGFVFQTFHLVPVLTLEDNVALPFILDGKRRRDVVDRARAALAAVGLAHRCRHLPDEVSVGERQRTAIARALVTEPDVIFADEPTGSLDRRRGDDVLARLRDAASAGRAVVLVTHDAHAAARADRTVRLSDGRVSA